MTKRMQKPGFHFKYQCPACFEFNDIKLTKRPLAARPITHKLTCLGCLSQYMLTIQRNPNAKRSEEAEVTQRLLFISDKGKNAFDEREREINARQHNEEKPAREAAILD